MAKINLTEFVKELQKRAKSARPRLKKVIAVDDFGGKEIVLESLVQEEIDSIKKEYSDDGEMMDKTTVYQGSSTIRELAVELIKLETISEPLQIMDLFKSGDVNAMAKIVVKLTNDYMAPTIREVEAIKN